MTRLRMALYAATIASLLIALLKGGPPDQVVQPVQRQSAAVNETSTPPSHTPSDRLAEDRSKRTGKTMERLLDLKPRRELLGAAGEEGASAHSSLFLPRNWAPPAAPGDVASAPALPPLPFVYVGKQTVDGQWQVFLQDKDDLRMVKVADVIESTYKVLQIQPPSMTLEYLPTHETQTLTIE